jgi:hypothetical protein
MNEVIRKSTIQVKLFSLFENGVNVCPRQDNGNDDDDDDNNNNIRIAIIAMYYYYDYSDNCI